MTRNGAEQVPTEVGKSHVETATNFLGNLSTSKVSQVRIGIYLPFGMK